jgi:hypothetical protein
MNLPPSYEANKLAPFITFEVGASDGKESWKFFHAFDREVGEKSVAFAMNDI